MIEAGKYLWFFGSAVTIVIIIVVWLKIYYKNLAQQPTQEHQEHQAHQEHQEHQAHQEHISNKEGFTAAFEDPSDSKPWALAGNAGLKPLVLNNLSGVQLPIRKLGVSYPGSISYIVGQYIQRKIYPVSLSTRPSTATIMAGLIMDGFVDGTTDNLDIGFIREPQLLGLARTESGIKSLSVLAPAYCETLYLIGNKYTNFAGLVELKRSNVIGINQQQPATQKIGVLRDSLQYWEAITRALELEIGRDFLKSENDNLAQLLAQLERREIDAVFILAHTFDSRLQAFLKTNEARMISIYPRSKYPQDTDMIMRPYNPETTDLIAKFRADMKVYIPWIFEETVSIGTAVGNKKQLSIGNTGPGAGTAGSSIYKTFKIRAYLCTSRQLGRDQEFITMLGSKYLEEYQSLGLLIQEWGAGNKKSKTSDKTSDKTSGKTSDKTSDNSSHTAKQLVLPTLVFADYDSFNPDTLGAVPNEIDLNPIVRDLIAKIYGRIKIENTGKSCDI